MQPSVKSLVLACTLASKSLMKRRNRSGPNTVPCGTPLNTGVFSDVAPSTI